jgi:hypothetical protein
MAMLNNQMVNINIKFIKCHIILVILLEHECSVVISGIFMVIQSNTQIIIFHVNFEYGYDMWLYVIISYWQYWQNMVMIFGNMWYTHIHRYIHYQLFSTDGQRTSVETWALFTWKQYTNIVYPCRTSWDTGQVAGFAKPNIWFQLG